VEPEQARIKIAEMEERQGSLRLGYEKLGSECENLCNIAEILKQEKAEAEKTREVEVVTVHIRLQDYCMHHHKKLCDL
jgi:hypothetical protein